MDERKVWEMKRQINCLSVPFSDFPWMLLPALVFCAFMSTFMFIVHVIKLDNDEHMTKFLQVIAFFVLVNTSMFSSYSLLLV